MPVLSRKKNEQIQIGDDIVVVYLGKNRYGQTEIGIEAPKHVRISRLTELWKPIGPRSELTEPAADR